MEIEGIQNKPEKPELHLGTVDRLCGLFDGGRYLELEKGGIRAAGYPGSASHVRGVV